MSVLAKIIATLALELVSFFLNRKTLKDGVRKDIALKAETLAKKAYSWKADHPISRDNIPAGLRLRKRSKHNRLQDKGSHDT